MAGEGVTLLMAAWNMLIAAVELGLIVVGAVVVLRWLWRKTAGRGERHGG